MERHPREDEQERIPPRTKRGMISGRDHDIPNDTYRYLT